MSKANRKFRGNDAKRRGLFDSERERSRKANKPSRGGFRY